VIALCEEAMMDGMKVVSRRAAGSNPLDDAARLQRTLRGLRGGLVRRGVYRFSSFEEADAWMMSQIASTAARPNLKTSSVSAARSIEKGSGIS
jgi:hypothetical protein